MLDNEYIRTTLIEALTGSVAEIIKDIGGGKFDTIKIDCQCGKGTHRADAAFCANCGKKLEKADGDGSF